MKKSELRQIIREEIQALKEGSMFMIGAGGMEALTDDAMLILPKSHYYLGASSMPDMVFVSKIDDTWISYHKMSYGDSAYTAELKIERPIGMNLIKKGTETWSKSYGTYFPKLKKSFSANLAGKKGSENGKAKLKDWDFRYVTCNATKNTRDLYGSSKNYGVLVGWNGESDETGKTIIRTRMGDVADMRKDKDFTVGKVSTKETKL